MVCKPLSAGAAEDEVPLAVNAASAALLLSSVSYSRLKGVFVAVSSRLFEKKKALGRLEKYRCLWCIGAVPKCIVRTPQASLQRTYLLFCTISLSSSLFYRSVRSR